MSSKIGKNFLHKRCTKNLCNAQVFLKKCACLKVACGKALGGVIHIMHTIFI